MERIPLVIIFTTVLLDLIGFGIVIPLISVYGAHYGASPARLALLGAAYSVMQFIFAPLWGTLSDRIGRRPILLLSLLGSTVSYALFGCAQSFNALLLSRVLAGIFAANISTAQAYMSDITPPEKRASAMGLIGAAFGLGFILGPPLGGVSAAYLGLSGPGYIAATICGLNLILAYMRLPESHPPHKRSSKRDRSLLPLSWANLRVVFAKRELRTLMIMFFCATVAFAHLEQVFSLLFQKRFFPETEEASFYSGVLLGWSGVLGVLVQGVLIRKLEHRCKLWTLVAVGFAICSVTYTLFPFVPSYTLYYVIAIPLALGGGLLNPSINGLISKNSTQDDQGATFGVSQGLASLARALAPLSAQISFGWYYALPFLIAGLISTVMFGLAFSFAPAGRGAS